jgi:hypothetical protein
MAKLAKIKSINQQIVTKLDVMKLENEHFETTELNRSNKTLYSLLGQVYEVVELHPNLTQDLHRILTHPI